jgi:hypothetical protein
MLLPSQSIKQPTGEACSSTRKLPVYSSEADRQEGVATSAVTVAASQSQPTHHQQQRTDSS